jgi:hypothetical protein
MGAYKRFPLCPLCLNPFWFRLVRVRDNNRICKLSQYNHFNAENLTLEITPLCPKCSTKYI